MLFIGKPNRRSKMISGASLSIKRLSGRDSIVGVRVV